MSLPFSAGIGRYAEDMGTYCENVQKWLDVAKFDLSERGLSDRFYSVLGINQNFFVSVDTIYETSEMDRQLAVLALAMSTGTRFEFENGKYANGWIGYMLKGFVNSSELDLQEYLLPTEILQLGNSI